MRVTSLEALESLQVHEPTIREQVTALFVEYGAMSDEDLVDVYHAVHTNEVKESTIRARRIENGRIVPTGETKINRSGRRAMTWDLVNG